MKFCVDLKCVAGSVLADTPIFLAFIFKI